MTKLYCLFFMVVFFVLRLSAQQRMLHGYLQDSITDFPIAGGIVTNVTSKKKISTDANGYFRLEAAPQDFLFFLAKSYHYDTLTYSFFSADTITLYLSPAANILPGVTVTTHYTKYQLDSMKRRSEFDELRGKQINAISAPNSGGFGIALNLDRLFKKRYKHRKRSEGMYETVEKSAYVDYRFSPHLVASYTGLKGDSLRSFIQRFTPGYTWLRQHPNNEDMMYYINDKLKEFRSLPTH